MNRIEWQLRRSMLERELKALPASTSCKECAHFRPADICNEFDQPVPAEFQPQGCDSWTWDGVPF